MPVLLHNTLTRRNEPLAPADGRTLRAYCCGPTVYGPAHIGNFRTFLLQDVLRRVLEEDGAHATPPWSVLHVRNLTDVDDKTIAGAIAAGESLSTFTARWTARFHADCAALGLLPPHHEPAATAHIAEQVDLINALLRRGHAYVAPDGSVYFRVGSFAGYGGLSKLAYRELTAGASGTVATDEYARDTISDFALWKAWKPSDGPVKWPGPVGAAEGRPGWHIECSAMSCKYLGSTFDLHAGGVDLVFPHHENEIAQSECGYGAAPFARHWFHTEHLLVEGRKMSKSLGNLFTLDDLVAKGFTPMEVRYALLAGHYRKPLNFTLDALQASRSALHRLADFLAALDAAASGMTCPPGVATAFETAILALRDDLNVPEALGQMFATLRQIRPTALAPASAAREAAGLRRVLHLLGIVPSRARATPSPPENARILAEKRWSAKQARDFAEADRLRAELHALGWDSHDRRDGYTLVPRDS